MKKIKNFRWYMILLVCFITIINYLDRTALGIAAPTIMESTGITKEQYSWVVSAFQLAYTIGQPIMGFFIDTIGLKLGFFICAIVWGLATMGHALTGTWQGLAFMRGLMGFSEASAIPSGVKTASTWFPAKERGIATGVFNMGTSFGAMLAPPLIAWCILFHSWQFAFIVSGSLAIVAAFVWYFCYKDPKEAKRLSDEERRYIEAGQEAFLQSATQEKTSVRHIITQRNFWGIGIARFLADPAWGTINFWVPIFFVETLHFSLKEIAMFVWLPFLMADLGCLASGFVAKFFNDRGVTLINSRRITFTLGALLMTTIGLVSIVENPYIAVLLISIGGFAHQLLSTVAATLGADLFKKNEVATAVGMAGACAWSGQLIFNLFIGAFVGIIGFGPFFIALAVFDLIGALALWLLIVDRQPAAHGGDATLAEPR
ncbi:MULTISPECIES: MFS transporter [Edwardsiella]|uniref:Hexuronate transporter ExuT n=2 Tax=Edwardsiella anguillarum TaxID=1821960 RepID=A0A076LVD5_9GAMM|nr:MULTISPECIES: MFS transporter [Edwardsiella]AIJ10403.1 hexuronate transporter ExuT [Edwardsiella anguillarum ET080813]KAB0586466.1 MFS transporter [Edwardsiella anguillarum]UBU94543.1 MFS transporter [Edwardsiella sp. LADL05-105]UOU77592.1 MFS transporter [Edwardsiella anguillarum]WHP78829.1 MFS transporter [Edwardsiella anguillarum]